MSLPELIYRGPAKATDYHADEVGRSFAKDDEARELLAGLGPTLSSTLAHLLVTKSALHAWASHPKLGASAERKETAAFATGDLFHALLLDAPSSPEVWPIEADNFKTKAAREARDEALANGAVPVLLSAYDAAVLGVEKVRARLLDRWGVELHKGRREEAIVYRDELGESGRFVTCRSMLDCVQGLDVYDLKTTRSAHPDDAAKSVGNYGYAIQRAAYTSAVEAAEGPDSYGRVSFRFVFVEPVEPYAIGVYDLDGAYRELGERQWQRGRKLFEQCLRSGKWPGYEGTSHLIAPPWILKG